MRLLSAVARLYSNGEGHYRQVVDRGLDGDGTEALEGGTIRCFNGLGAIRRYPAARIESQPYGELV